jgi:molybdopterin-guanine dinucleotide biosynthesis protein A
VDGQAGWAIEASSLREVLTDRQRAEQALATAGPADRLFLLGLLGRADQGVAEGRHLLEDPAPGSDPWQLLLRLADLHSRRSDFAAAEQRHRQAWRHALGRERQAATLHSIGVRQFEQGDRDAAAASFTLALTLLSLFRDSPLRARTAAALALVRAGTGLEDGFDAVILAGGRGRRMAGGSGGTAKPLRRLAGWPMLDHVLLAASAASRQIVVGSSRIGIGEPVFCREEPAGSGPVAGLSAGLRHVQQPVVLLLAADLPFVAGALGPLRALLAGEPGTDATALVDPAGRVNYLAAAWRTGALYAALDRLGDPAGRPVRALYDSVAVRYLPDFDAWGADCDTPQDLRLAEDRIRRRSPGRLPEAQLAWPRLELHSPS